MPTPTREDRRRRITEDDGDPDDRVVLPVGDGANSVYCYHAHTRCYTIRTDTDCERVTREQAQQNGKAPCKVCVLDNVEYENASLSSRLLDMSPEEAGLTPTPPRPDDARPDVDVDVDVDSLD